MRPSRVVINIGFYFLWIFTLSAQPNLLVDDQIRVIGEEPTLFLGQSANFGYTSYSWENERVWLNTYGYPWMIDSRKNGMGNLLSGDPDPLTTLQLYTGSDASLTSHGYLILGKGNGGNLVLDNNEIMARTNGAKSTLFLNYDGGHVTMLKDENDILRVRGKLRVDEVPFGDRKNMQYDNSTGQLYYDNSSRRYKENVQTLEDDWLRILQARPVRYTRKHAPDLWEYGYIAEEVDSLGLANLVGYDSDGIPDDVKYDKMVLYLVECLKICHEKIAELEKVLQDLTSKKRRKKRSKKGKKNNLP